MPQIQLGDRLVGDNTDAFVIAEIGQNHQGDLELCRRLFKAAADAGAHAVKLQKRDNRTLFTPAMLDAPYQSENAFGNMFEWVWETFDLPKGYSFEVRAGSIRLAKLRILHLLSPFLTRIPAPCRRSRHRSSMHAVLIMRVPKKPESSRLPRP